MTYLFVDTNVLLHYRRLDEIDWLGLFKSKEVVVVLCPTVVRELDRHKVSHTQKKFRKRAQEINADLHRRLSGVDSIILRGGVRLEFVAEDPKLDFGLHNLRHELPDDWIIASVLEWIGNHPSDETKLVSADLGLAIKAKAKGIPAIEPPDADKLPDELDADEKRIKLLQEELAELKNALPDLKLCFADGASIAETKVLPPTELDAKCSKLAMEHLQANYPTFPPTEEPKSTSKGYMSFLKRDVYRSVMLDAQIPSYNSRLESFYEEYEQYIRASHDHQNMERRTIKLEIVLQNIGGCPAEDVDIHFHFPDGFLLFDAVRGDYPRPPEQPHPPEKPGTLAFNMNKRQMAAMMSAGSIPVYQRASGPPPNVSSPSIQRTNSYDVKCHVRNAKHNCQVSVAQFLAVFDSYESAKSFQIDYSILAANFPKTVTGQLSVLVRKQKPPD